MKAAVLYTLGTAPKYADFPDPQPQNDSQVVVHIKAAAVKNLDKGIASGHHYSSANDLPKVVGIDGAGITLDGTKVYAMGITGMIAEKALVDKSRLVKIPEQLDFVTAAALPNAVMGAAGALHYRAKLQKGETVLINGATGVTGMVAVQIARHYGAKKIIVTGRDPDSLKRLRELGADEVISLKQDDEALTKAFKDAHHATPIDVVIDYTWGHPIELLLGALHSKGGATHPVRLVTVGGMAGDKITLSSGTLRSADITICGSGLGSLSPAHMQGLFKEILPEMMQLAVEGKLVIDTEAALLSNVETAWNKEVPSGKRLVIVIENK